MQAVVNRLDDLQEDINLYRLFNQNPEWDEEKGTYTTNRYSRNGDDDEEQEGEESDAESEDSEEGEDTDAGEETADSEEGEDTDGDAVEDDDTDDAADDNEESGEDEEDSEDEEEKDPKSALDFRQFLEDDCIILFDTGDLVRDASQQAFSMYVLSALWGSIRSRYNNLESHESIPGTTKIVIEESAPIVSTELVTNTLIPEAREFGLSLGMIMQYPAQVMTSGVDGSFDELKNNVETKIYGHIDPKRDIADSLVHDEKDTTAIKNKIRRLGGGEWIVDLPAPTFDVEVPPPFSLTSLDIPEGHPAGDNPLNASQRESVNRQVNQRKNRTRNRYGIERLTAEELAAQSELAGRDSFTNHTEAGGEDTEDTTNSATAASVQHDDEDSDTSVSDGSFFSGTHQDEANFGSDADESDTTSRGEETATAQSDTSRGVTPELTGSTNNTDSSENIATPMDSAEIQEHVDDPTFDSRDGVTDTALELSDQLHTVDYERAAYGLSVIAQENGVDIEVEELLELPGEHAMGDGPPNTSDSSSSTPAGIEPPDGSNVPNAFDYDDSDDDEDEDEGERVDATADESGAPQTAENSCDADSTSAGPDGPSVAASDNETADEPSSDNVESSIAEALPDEIEDEALAALGVTSSEEGDDRDSKSAKSNTHPTDVKVEAPLHKSFSTLSTTERDGKELSEDDEQFMALIADAFSENLPDYELTESMTGLRDRAGDPDIDKLEELGYIDTDKVLRKTYYSLTREGWRIIADKVPGNDFGDHMEKMKHRVGVYLLVQQAPSFDFVDVDRVESYAEYQGETYDAIGYDSDGDISLVAEVETASNNKEALLDDYEKLAAAPGNAAWVYPKHATGHELWDVLEEEVLEHEYSKYVKQNAGRLNKRLTKKPESGANITKTYNQLLSDD